MLLGDKQAYHVHKGDAITHMLEGMPAESVDVIVSSPPFPSLYAYSSDEADVGNSEELDGEAKAHMAYVFAGVARVLKPGRVAVVHCQQIPNMKRSGKSGCFDFRGLLIRLGQRAGLVYEYDWLVRVNPQSQAIRNKSWQLKFQGLETDRAMSRGALCPYLIKFRAPGENAVPVASTGEVSRNDWISWAEGSWGDIRETDTLNFREAKGKDDTKHICPLQLEIIERCVRLYSNPGEVVFDPFMGVGSVGFVALGGESPVTKRRIADPRRAYGCELKPEYHAAAVRNCKKAIAQHKESQKSLFDAIGEATSAV